MDFIIHISATLDFNLLGKVDVRQQLDSAYRQNIKKHNEQAVSYTHLRHFGIHIHGLINNLSTKYPRYYKTFHILIMNK